MPAFMAETRGMADRYNYQKTLTATAVICCVVASSGGLLFGYDLGVAGGVSSMPRFLQLFFPSVYESEYGVNKFETTSPYCKFDSQTLQVFQSSLYLAALVASLAAAYISKIWGRRFSMICAGVCYLAGAGLTSGAVNKQSGLAMLIVGRCLLGCGVGFGNSSVTIYSSEMSPPKYRGMLNLLFQWCVTIGIIIAQLINYGTIEVYEYGWRISLAIAAVPGFIILFGGFLLPETPSFLIGRNRHEEGRQVLQRLRGQDDVELEFQDILSNTRMDSLVKNPLVEVFKTCYRPYLTISILIGFFQQLTGINAIMFYAPQLFSSISASSRKASLLNTVIIGAVNVVSTLVAIVTVDRFGRKKLLIYSGAIMIGCQVIVAGVLGYYFSHTNGTLPDNVSNGVLAVICVYVANFAWSWGPLGWLVPAEIQPHAIRPAGMAMSTSSNMIFTFVIGQCFLSMLCHFRWGVFLFFGGWTLLAIIFVALFIPECKGLHVEEVPSVFASHWFWKRYPQPTNPMPVPQMDEKLDSFTKV